VRGLCQVVQLTNNHSHALAGYDGYRNKQHENGSNEDSSKPIELPRWYGSHDALPVLRCGVYAMLIVQTSDGPEQLFRPERFRKIFIKTGNERSIAIGGR